MSVEAPPASTEAAAGPETPQLEVPEYGFASDWATQPEANAADAVLDVKDAGRVGVTLADMPDKKSRTLYVDLFAASPDAAEGAGKALLSAAIAEGRRYNADTLTGHFTNGRALGALRSVVGDGRLSYFRAREQVDIPFDEAVQKPELYLVEADISGLESPGPN